MKKVLLYLISVVIILFNSCTKNAGPDAGNRPDTSLKVKTLTEDYRLWTNYGSDQNPHTVFILEYDAENKLIKMKSDSVNIDFEYSNNIIKKNTYTLSRYGDYSEQHINYYFNNISLLLDSSISVTEGTVDTAIVRSVYFYNSENKRELEIITSTDIYRTIIDTGFYKYDNNGNLFSRTRPSYPYYEENTYYDSVNFHNSADMIYPDRINNPNLLKEYNSAFNSVFGGIERFSYKFDSNHRISVITDSGSYTMSPPWIFTQSFTYY